MVVLLGSVAALLELFPYTPRVGGLIRGGGLLGYLLTLALVYVFNYAGAVIVAGTLMLTSLFIVTRFSFSATLEFSRERVGLLKPLISRWDEWQEKRRREKAKKKVEISRVIGKQPAEIQKVVSRPAPEPAITGPKTISVAPAAQTFPRPVTPDFGDPTRIKIPLPPVARSRGLDLDEAPRQDPHLIGRLDLAQDLREDARAGIKAEERPLEVAAHLAVRDAGRGIG